MANNNLNHIKVHDVLKIGNEINRIRTLIRLRDRVNQELNVAKAKKCHKK
jgi:hypothetical protein